MPDQRLLIADLDGTLLGNDAALSEFADWMERARNQWRLAYSSGRLFGSVMESIRETLLPEPDVVISGVGTEIHDFPTQAPWDVWTARFSYWDAANVIHALEEFTFLRLQPKEFLSPFKVSYFAHNLTPHVLREIDRVLEAHGLKTRLVYSSARDLDVLPEAAGKGHASVYVAQTLGIPQERVAAAGDSGNDECMLKRAGRGIVVANALPELKILREPNIYHSPYEHAAGVLDGLTIWLNGEEQD